jgi:membrane-associated phospholipid phosphatase
VDWAVAAYTLGVGLLALFRARTIAQSPLLVIGHGALLAVLFWLPVRGARWEQRRSDDASWLAAARRVGRFLRYTYPALLLTPFFEEVRLTVNATSPSHPYWFEAYLYAADRMLFGTTPAVAMSEVPSPILDELMHGLYFAYYPLIIGGIVTAWMGSNRAETPGAGFHTAMTSMMLGFFFAYVWYPFLPARGPWENRELMSGLRTFDGFVFTPLVQWIIERAGVSGGCFPSAHVAGTWALIVGLAATHRRPALWLGLAAVGLGVSCVYTRYHHAVDVVAGLIVGVAGGALGRVLTQSREGGGHGQAGTP